MVRIAIIIRFHKLKRIVADNNIRVGGTLMQEARNLEMDYQEENYIASDLYMIESIDADNNLLVIANYMFNKKITVSVTDKQIEFYANAFDKSLEQNMYLFVEYDESEGTIIGR